MSSSLEPRYTRIIATFVMLIDLFLVSSMTYIALSGAEFPTSVTFKMFVIGLIAGGVITAFGAILLHFSKLGELGSS